MQREPKRQSSLEGTPRAIYTRRRLIGGAAGVATAFAAACGGSGTKDGSQTAEQAAAIASVAATTPEAGTPKRGGVWREPVQQTIPNLDIHKTNGGSVYWDWIGNFLVRFDVRNPGKIEPDIAAALPEVPDELSFVFKVNPAAKWQQRPPVDGRRVVAEDVKFTFEDVIDPKTTSPRMGNYTQVDRIETPDENTVVFRMKSPKPDLLATMADQYDFIYPREWAAPRPALGSNAAEVVGTGPYELTFFSSDQGYKLERRKDGYWKPNTAWLDGADFRIVADVQSQIAGLLAGQFEGMAGGSGFKDRQSDVEKAGFRVVEYINPARNTVVLNHKAPPFADPRVRLAMSRAINRRQAYDLAYAGAGTVGGAISPSMTTWRLPENELRTLPGYLPNHEDDLKEARLLMDAAGMKDGFDVTCDTLFGQIRDLDTVLVPMYRDLKVNVTLRDVGSGGALAILQRYAAPDFRIGGFAPIAGPYPDAQLILYHNSNRALGTRNYGNYTNERVDDLLSRQSRTFDENERRKLVFEVQRIVAQEPGPLWSGSYHTLRAHTPAVRGYARTNFNSGYQIAHNVWLDK